MREKADKMRCSIEDVIKWVEVSRVSFLWNSLSPEGCYMEQEFQQRFAWSSLSGKECTAEMGYVAFQ